MLLSFTERLMTYALGRRVERLRHADSARDREGRGQKTTTACRRSFSGVVDSAAFQSSCGRTGDDDDRAAGSR